MAYETNDRALSCMRLCAFENGRNQNAGCHDNCCPDSARLKIPFKVGSYKEEDDDRREQFKGTYTA